MQLVAEVERLQRRGHAHLRTVQERATAALAALLEEERRAATPETPAGLFDDAIVVGAAETPSPIRPLYVERAHAHWHPFASVLTQHLDTWESVLWPQVQQWNEGRLPAEYLLLTVEQMLACRQQLNALLPEVRTHVSFVGPIRRHVMAVFSALDKCAEEEADVVEMLMLMLRTETSRTATGSEPLLELDVTTEEPPHPPVHTLHHPGGRVSGPGDPPDPRVADSWLVQLLRYLGW